MFFIFYFVSTQQSALVLLGARLDSTNCRIGGLSFTETSNVTGFREAEGARRRATAHTTLVKIYLVYSIQYTVYSICWARESLVQDWKSNSPPRFEDCLLISGLEPAVQVFGWCSYAAIIFNDVACTQNTAVESGGCFYGAGTGILNNGTVMNGNHAMNGGCLCECIMCRSVLLVKEVAVTTFAFKGNILDAADVTQVSALAVSGRGRSPHHPGGSNTCYSPG